MELATDMEHKKPDSLQGKQLPGSLLGPSDQRHRRFFFALTVLNFLWMAYLAWVAYLVLTA